MRFRSISILSLAFSMLITSTSLHADHFKVLVILSDKYAEPEAEYVQTLTSIGEHTFSYEVIRINPDVLNRGWEDALDLSQLSEAEILALLSRFDIIYFTWNGPGHDRGYYMRGAERAFREWVRNGGVVWFDAFDDNFTDDQGNQIGLWFPVDEYPARVLNVGDSDVEITPEGESSGLFSTPNLVDVNAIVLDDNFADLSPGYIILANRADGLGPAAFLLPYGLGYYVGMCLDTREDPHLEPRLDVAKPMIENALYYLARLKSSINLPTTTTLVVRGSITYADQTPVPAGWRVEVENIKTGEIVGGETEEGSYEITLSTSEDNPLRSGDALRISVSIDDERLSEAVRMLAPEEIQNGLVEHDLRVNGLRRLQIIGTVYEGDGITPAGGGITVKAVNLSAVEKGREISPATGTTETNGGYELILTGPALVVMEGEVIRVEALKDGRVVGAMEHTITAEELAEGTVRIDVTFDSEPPTPSLEMRGLKYVGYEVIFDASASTDNVGIKSYIWDFGDGSSGEGTVVSHVYEAEGVYVVKLTVTDFVGNSSTAEEQITIETVQEIRFADPNLEAAVRAALNKPEGPLTGADLQQLTKLMAGGRGIRDLSGIEFCVNLRELWLWGNQISDVKPLGKLTKLEKLYLWGNLISDISPLSEAINLKVLNLGNNQISDIKPLARLTKLKVLSLSANQISDINALSELVNLEELWLGNNQISNIRPLSKLTKLQILSLGDNQVSDIRPLSRLTGLRWLKLRGNLISDISPLSKLMNLEVLYLEDNKIADVSPLSGLTELKILYLDNNQIQDISPLVNLNKLGEYQWWVPEREGVRIHLGLSNNQIQDITPLVENSGIDEGDGIDLKGNPLSLKSINLLIPKLKRRGVNVLYDAPATLPGDVSGNGLITSYDASLILRYLVGKEELSDEQKQRGDVSGNGDLSAYDAALIIQFVVGLIDSFQASQGAPSLDGMRKVVSIGTVKGKAGGRVRVPVMIDNPEGIVSGELAVRFDPAVLRFVRAESEYDLVESSCDGGKLKVAFAGEEAVERRQIMWLEFEVLRGDEDYVDLVVERCRLNEGLEVEVKGGRVELIPGRSELLQNYPNPFNAETWIPYRLAEDGRVVIRIYDVRGRLVRELDLGWEEAGSYTVRSRAAYWDGRNELGERVASGVYIYQIIVGKKTFTRRMILLK